MNTIQNGMFNKSIEFLDLYRVVYYMRILKFLPENISLFYVTCGIYSFGCIC